MTNCSQLRLPLMCSDRSPGSFPVDRFVDGQVQWHERSELLAAGFRAVRRRAGFDHPALHHRVVGGCGSDGVDRGPCRPGGSGVEGAMGSGRRRVGGGRGGSVRRWNSTRGGSRSGLGHGFGGAGRGAAERTWGCRSRSDNQPVGCCCGGRTGRDSSPRRGRSIFRSAALISGEKLTQTCRITRPTCGIFVPYTERLYER